MTNFSRNEKIFFALAVGLGVFIRFLNLGALPLSDGEARWALQALDLARGLRPEIAPAPAYVTLTGLVFYITTASDALARFFPALAGSLLVLAPLFFTRWFTPRTAVVLAFGLAIDPGMVALSRTAGGGMMSIGFAALAVGLWLDKKPRAAGIFAGLALLSGPVLWGGLLILLIAGLIFRGLIQNAKSALVKWPRESLRQAGVTALVVFFAVGSLFFTAPNGLGAALAAPISFLQGWFTSSSVPVNRLVLALLFYHLLPLAFGMAGLVRGLRSTDTISVALGIWLGVALALALASPGRQVTDLAWALIPLWGLAAREIARIFEGAALTWEAGGAFGLTVAIITFAWLDLASITPGLEQTAINLRLALFGGSLLLLGLSLVLVALGWSPDAARLGGLGGVLAALTVLTLAATWGAGGMRTSRTPEMWRTDPAMDQSALLAQTIADLAEWREGVPTSLPVTVLGLESPALNWALRDFSVRQVPIYDPTLSDSLIVSYDDPNLAFGQTYRGQDFYLRRYPAWDSASLLDWIDWLTRRKIPYGQDRVILWASAEIFPDSPKP